MPIVSNILRDLKCLIRSAVLGPSGLSEGELEKVFLVGKLGQPTQNFASSVFVKKWPMLIFPDVKRLREDLNPCFLIPTSYLLSL